MGDLSLSDLWPRNGGSMTDHLSQSSSPDTCPKHPNYRGKKKPKRDCEHCRAYYRWWVDLRARSAWDDICWGLGVGRWGQ